MFVEAGNSAIVFRLFISDLEKTILSKLNKSYTFTSLALLAVDVGEEEDYNVRWARRLRPCWDNINKHLHDNLQCAVFREE